MRGFRPSTLTDHPARETHEPIRARLRPGQVGMRRRALARYDPILWQRERSDLHQQVGCFPSGHAGLGGARPRPVPGALPALLVEVLQPVRDLFQDCGPGSRRPAVQSGGGRRTTGERSRRSLPGPDGHGRRSKRTRRPLPVRRARPEVIACSLSSDTCAASWIRTSSRNPLRMSVSPWPLWIWNVPLCVFPP